MRDIFRKGVLILALTLTTALARAQDEEYFSNSWYSCDLTSHQFRWQIMKYKINISSVFPLVDDSGSLTFSDDCIEINCRSVQMHFPVKKYIRLTPTSFAVEREGEDEYFDYIEVVPNSRGSKTVFKVMLAMREPDGTLQNTHIFVCRAKQGNVFPPQVPDI